jgi:hypothetical protein
MPQSKKLTELKTIPFQGGMNTYNEPGMLPLGGYSAINNMRNMRPGLKARKGYIKKHSTADGTNSVLSMFQFSKGKRTESHFYALMSDNDILEATDAPPTVTTGAFGSEVYNGTEAKVTPTASWSVLNDELIFSNGYAQHQICAGTANYISYFGVFDSDTQLPDIPTFGYDYTSEVSDASATTVAVLDSLGNFVATTGTLVIPDIEPSFVLEGSGTKFLTELTVGQPIYVAGYEKNFVATITSDTAGTVTTAWTVTMELMTLDVAPGTTWAAGDTITGVTSNQTCIITQKLTDLTYEIRSRSGAFTLGEVLTNGTYTADQGAANPIITSTVTYTTSNDCLLICCSIMPNRLTFTIPAGNGNASVATASYPTSAGWKNLTITDGTRDTATSTKTMNQTGSITWTQPTDAIPKYMFDKNGFWVKVSFSVALDSEVEVSSVTYGSGFTSIQNVWDGALVDAVEAQFYKNSTTTYYIYGTTSITLGGMTSSDYLYFNSPDPIVATFIDVAGTPNTTGSTTINAFQYLASSGSWTTVGTYTDGTSGLSKTGYVTFKRQSDISPQQFNGLGYSSYWYRFTVDQTLSASCNIGIMVIPYYEISDYGVGVCSSTWKDKMVYTFDQDPSWMYISAPNAPQVLESSNSAIFQAGDGRANKIVVMKPFYNELLICQEEKGASGGCITLLQGTKPEDLGKINLSNFYGAMNSQSMEVIETIEGGHNAFILSKRGIIVTDGKSVGFVPNFDKIRNYFDPSSSASIRSGYESKMYLKYDSSYYVLKIGLVTGTSATENNTFLVYDILTKEFSTDTYANNFSCECECDAASGDAPIVQMAGGQANGFIYIMNNGDNDVSTAVDSYVTLEFNAQSGVIRDAEMIIRVKTQATGEMVVTPYYNGVVQTSMEKTLSLKVERTSDRIRRHRIPLNFKDQNVSVKIRHNTTSESFYLLDYAVMLEEYIEQ